MVAGRRSPLKAAVGHNRERTIQIWSITMKIFALTHAPLFLAAAIAPLAAQSVDRLAGKNVSIAQTNYQGRDAIQGFFERSKSSADVSLDKILTAVSCKVSFVQGSP